MVQINQNLGKLNLKGLSQAKGAEVQKKEDFKPKTEVEPLRIYINGEKRYDNGEQDWIICINTETGAWGISRDDGDSKF